MAGLPKRQDCMNNGKSSMAGELMPRKRKKYLDHHSLLSLEILKLHQPETETDRHT